MTSNPRSLRRAARLSVLCIASGALLAACSGGGFVGTGATVKRAAFTSSEYGVAVSPRVTTNPNPPRGGGRYQVGNAYTVRGVTYTPAHQPDYSATGTASWYGSDFHGRKTANGEIFSANAITGAHPTLPLPSYVRVTNLDNGRAVTVRINDRGPYVAGRIIDLSHRSAELLGYVNKGSTNVHVAYVGPAPLEGDDTRMLLASVSGPPLPQQGNTRVASSGGGRPTSLVGMASDFIGGMFGYADPAEGARAISAAHAAAEAMATRPNALDAWAETIDEDARAIRLSLGAFANRDNADRLATEFALLGAVEETEIEIGGRRATQLTLTRLKPGVGRTDVIALADRLGLTGLSLR
ncbi:septal ring lytic transglycosylase RlpA family protein [Arsenicitalea aurantiaca]|uniref:septal ring lytic transglycosylase RlpA family protein n=1 Tax=Arsenicitalea aurantiaca TaxID=1783274 RepID=UPI001FCE5DBC|nr:septal ring lytic transglycosylase RlpA family protein [Arsenicitalea aurantiaca]